MLRKLILGLFLLSLTFLVPQKAFAALYINEFSSEGSSDWVEIYNSDATSVDLSLWRLRDSTSSNKVDLTGTIDANGFASFDFGDNLNNGGDTIRLVLKTDENNSISQVVYGTPGDLGIPASGQTGGRNPDGSSNWVILASASKGSSNNSSSVVPTNTPTPTDAPSPSKTPTPTKSPTTAPTSTPVKSPTPTVKAGPTATPIKSLNPTSGKPSPTDDPNSSLRLGSSSDNDIFGNETPTPAQSDGQVLGASTFNSIPWVFVGLGLIFLIVCGILSYFQFGDKILPKFLKRKRNETD